MNMLTLTSHMPFIRRQNFVGVEAIGWTSFVLSIITGATSTPFAKQLSGFISPISMVFLSELSVLCFMVLSFGLVPLIRAVFRIHRDAIVPLLGFSILNSIIAPILVFIGMQQTSAVNSELFLRSQTVFLLFFAAILLQEKIRREHILAGSIVLFGILMISLKGFTTGMVFAKGDLLIIAGALVYAFGTALIKKSIHSVHPEVALFFRGMVALSFFFVSSPFMRHTFLQELSAVPPHLFNAAVGYAFISCFLSLFCFYEAVERLDARTISIGLPVMSIGSIVFAHFYLGESLLWYHIFGAFFIVSGIIVMRVFDGISTEKELEQHYVSGYQRHI